MILPLYRSEQQIAAMLGMPKDWFLANRDNLEKQFGFPKIDPAIGKRHAPSVEAWANERNSRSTLKVSGATNNVENIHAL